MQHADVISIAEAAGFEIFEDICETDLHKEQHIELHCPEPPILKLMQWYTMGCDQVLHHKDQRG
jgi:hypothetical protein